MTTISTIVRSARSLSHAHSLDSASTQPLTCVFCRFYDADNDNIPQQAFEIVDLNGDPLGPYMMPTENYAYYVLDASSLSGGQGLYPYVAAVQVFVVVAHELKCGTR